MVARWLMNALCGCGPDDPSDPSTHTILTDDVDEEDDVYFPEDYSGDYPLDIE